MTREHHLSVNRCVKVGVALTRKSGCRLTSVDHWQVCHRAGGTGEPPIPLGVIRPGYIVAMPLDETSHAWHHGDEQLVQTILSGNRRTRTRMPMFDQVLTEADARDIVAYLKTFWSDRIVACQGPKHMSCM